MKGREAAVEVGKAVGRIGLEATETGLQLRQTSMAEYFDHTPVDAIDHIGR